MVSVRASGDSAVAELKSVMVMAVHTMRDVESGKDEEQRLEHELEAHNLLKIL